jgi:hypothetical protein
LNLIEDKPVSRLPYCPTHDYDDFCEERHLKLSSKQFKVLYPIDDPLQVATSSSKTLQKGNQQKGG